MEDGYDRLKAHMRRIGRCYWIRDHGAEVDIVDIGEETRQMVTEVKISFPMAHNVLTSVEEHVQ